MTVYTQTCTCASYVSYCPCREQALHKVTYTSSLQWPTIMNDSPIDHTHQGGHGVNATVVGDGLLMEGMNTAHSQVVGLQVLKGKGVAG